MFFLPPLGVNPFLWGQTHYLPAQHKRGGPLTPFPRGNFFPLGYTPPPPWSFLYTKGENPLFFCSNSPNPLLAQHTARIFWWRIQPLGITNAPQISTHPGETFPKGRRAPGPPWRPNFSSLWFCSDGASLPGKGRKLFLHSIGNSPIGKPILPQGGPPKVGNFKFFSLDPFQKAPRGWPGPQTLVLPGRLETLAPKMGNLEWGNPPIGPRRTVWVPQGPLTQCEDPLFSKGPKCPCRPPS